MHIYSIGTKENLQKIGFAKDPSQRLRQLQTGNPEQLFLHHTIEVPANRVRILERHLHKELGYLRTKGEWFRLSPEQSVDFLNFAVIRWLDDPLL
jgi:hypothetical protein